MTGYWQVNLRDMLNELGENGTQAILSSFSCPLNPDVEDFLKNKAVSFARQQWAATHLVFASFRDEPVLVGYYALANKYVSVKGTKLSSSLRKRLNHFAQYDPELKRYMLSLPLIGQLSKNYANGYNTLITGDELLKMACDRIRGIQFDTSGKMAYIECADHPKLIAFYEANGFRRFANRPLDGDEIRVGESPYLVQMLKYFHSDR